MKAASVSLAAVALFGLAALAQPPRPDPIEAAKANQRIADQKLEAEVRQAIENADRLARLHPDKAAKQIKDALASVDLSGNISNATRASLTKTLTAKLDALTGKPAAAPGVQLDPMLPIVKAAKNATREKYELEMKEVRDGLGLMKKYIEDNQLTSANRILAQLKAKYPDNPALITLAAQDNFKNTIALATDLTALQQKRVQETFFSVDKSNVPLGDRDVEFPKDWNTRVKNRAGLNDVKMTEKEKRILEALDKQVTLAGKDKPLEYLLQELSTAMDIPFFIEKDSLRALDIDLTRGASLDARGISGRNALRMLLSGQGLTYVIKDQTLQIMTVERARETLVARAYYLGDVVQGIGPFGGAATWGTFLDHQQTMSNVQTVIDMIQDSVDPMSWKKRGGAGTITFHFPSMSIIVRASSEVHAALGSKMGSK